MPGEAQILARGGGASIAYHRTPGRNPGVVFLTGFKSDMTGGKALALEALCRARGQAFLRFDYRGHGASSGAFEDGTIGLWLDDALAAIDELTEGPQVLVGSSMGGWIMLLAARARPDRIAGLVGIAAAPDFTRELVEQHLSEAQQVELMEKGRVVLPSAYEDDYVFTRALVEDGNARLLLDGEIAFDGPVRLLQGMKDDAVPWEKALAIQSALSSSDVEVTLVKDGDHRLSEPHDLARLEAVVSTLLDRLG